MPQMVGAAVSAHKPDIRPDTRFDRADFKPCGESALQLEVACYMPSPCTWTSWQAINLALLWRFRELGIAFAIRFARCIWHRMPVRRRAIRAARRNAASPGYRKNK
jgi:hypothetical protein